VGPSASRGPPASGPTVVMDALALVQSIPGWLRSEDANKLYELAGATRGPILEVGTYRGKSTVIMAAASQASQRPTTIYTLDVDRRSIDAAVVEAKSRGLADRIVFIRGTLTAFARAYPHLRPTLTFVDGDHSWRGVQHDLAVLDAIVPAGGQLLFHDFNDPRNEDPSCAEVKVRPAVQDSWVARECDFEGAFGVCGLFRRREAPRRSPVGQADLLPLASIREQYLHRVRYPAGRMWRRMRG